MSEYNTSQLRCGMRIITKSSSSDVLYLGIAVAAGTRNETETESGMAHFVEHLSFKGTSHRSARQIITCMESVGGDLNAYTGKEETVYYCTTLSPYLNRAVGLLLDILLCSVYPQHQMDREVEVVNDEIESYNDSPSELIYDEFEQLLFPGHPLGRNILGDIHALRGYRTEDVNRYVRRMYRPERMVLFVHGDVSHEKVVRMVERYLYRNVSGDLLTDALPVLSSRVDSLGDFVTDPLGETLFRSRGTHQSHVMLGTRCFGVTDPRYLHLYFLNNLLGGPGQSSRLNLSLRERKGLVYTVESSLVSYTDVGVWSVYFGCDHGDVKRCLRLVREELLRLLDKPLGARTMERARQQLKGQIGISYENGENVALGMAKRFLHYGNTQSRSELCARLDELEPESLWNTACEVFRPERMLTLVYGE